MRFVAPICAAVLLLLLTWLLVSGLNLNSARYDREAAAVEEFARIERALDREILTARVGIARQYDTIAGLQRALDRALANLRLSAGGDPGMAEVLDGLAGRVAQQEALIEQFKTNNALLRNSAAYFGLLSARLVRSSERSVVSASASLSASMIRLSIESSELSERDVRAHLDDLASLDRHDEDGDVVKATLAHGELLFRLFPAVDSILKQLSASASNEEQQVFRSVVVRRQREARAAARQYRLLLYSTSVMLVVVLIGFEWRFRRKAAALARRVNVEHVVARLSTRFLSSRAPEISESLVSSLHELADCIGADRAYFIDSAEPSRNYAWCGPETQFAAGWKTAALRLAKIAPIDAAGTIRLRLSKKLPEEMSTILGQMSMHTWLGFTGLGQHSGMLLGFDGLTAKSSICKGDVQLYRMAFDALANAAEREGLEREKARLQAKLQKARRMEVLGGFASGIAHNFNNIIGAISGYAEIACSEIDPKSREGRSVAEIGRAAERARSLVEQLLRFGRRREHDLSSVCVRHLLTEAKRLLDASLPPHVDLAIDDTGPAVIQGDLVQLQQVILNVCNNAAQAMEHPGTIKIEIETCDLEVATQIGEMRIAAAEYVRIVIVDSGRGMDTSTRERAFEPFFTTRVEGSGLGLATVREIVLDHHGAIRLESNPGEGTRCEIWFPRIEPVARSCDEDPGELSVGNGHVVLIVEPDPSHLLRHEDLLAALGYEPAGFRSSLEAATACRNDPGRFDAAIICQSAELSGVITTIRDRVPGMPIILSTRAASDLDVPELARSSIAEVIHHPLSSDELSRVLRRTIIAGKKGQR